MALLSLGLNRDEPQNSKAPGHLDKPRPGDEPAPEKALNPSEALEASVLENGGGILIGSEAGRAEAGSDLTGTVPVSDSTAPRVSADQSTHEEVSEDNWSEKGIEIIRSVLRDAETRMSRPALPGTSQTSPEGPEEVHEAPETEIADFSTAIEELHRQIAEMAESFCLAADSGESEPPLFQSVSKNKSTSTLISGVISAAGERPAKPAAGTSAAGKPAPEIPAGPARMEKLASGLDNVVSTAPTEFLSLVIEELRRKLEANECVEGPANRGVSSNPRAGDGRVPVPIRPQPFPAQNELSQSTLNMEAASGSLPRQNEIPKSAVNRNPVSAPVRARSAHNWTPKFATFKFGYLPSRGLLYSLIGHEVALFALFLLITYPFPPLRREKLIVGSVSSRDHVILLPEIGGGTKGAKSPGGGESKLQQAPAPPARASKGFAYSGPQAILSNPPNPTNRFQTLLRPLAVHPEPLKKLVPLPNVVEMAETRLPSGVVRSQAAMPRFHPPVQPFKVKQDGSLSRQARWDMPVKAPQLAAKAEMPELAAAEQPLPQALKAQPKPDEKPREVEKQAREPIKVNAEKKTERAEKEIAPPSTAQVARLAMHGGSQEPLLSLSPSPLPNGPKVPAGEARGRFAIAPGGRLNPNSANPGKPDATSPESPAAGQEKFRSANATTELASNPGTGAGHNPAAGGGSGNSKAASGGGPAGMGDGSGRTADAGTGGAASGDGRASAGGGAGRSGAGGGTGSGAGSGAGGGSFPGISIQGGEASEGTSEVHSLTIAPQTPYQMTIVATASSGGGLPDYGVFENERVYTVYVPMRRTPEAADPTWTLQYALEDTSTHDDSGQLVAPTAVMREWPRIPADLERTYAHEQVVVYAVLATDGKLTHISVKHTPDARVSAPIVQALAKWVFRPAQLDNRPVATKILIGIPL